MDGIEDAPIYRFLPLKWYDELINEKTIYFNKVSRWEDTWEIPCKQLDKDMLENDDMKRFMDAISGENDSLYGMCFCNEFNTDAMWRIYSPDKKSVCIQTTMKKIIHSLDKEKIVYGAAGSIMYRYWEGSSNIFDFENSMDTYPAICYFPFVKRIEFSHEKEIRLILRFNDDREDGVKIKIDLTNCIDKIILDPRLSDNKYENLKNRETLKDFKVERSNLYEKKMIPVKNPRQFWEHLMKINTGHHIVKNECFIKLQGKWIERDNETES